MLRSGRGRHCYLFSRLNSWLCSSRGGEVRKANSWRKARSTICFFTKSFSSYSPTTYKQFPVSFGFHLVYPSHIRNLQAIKRNRQSLHITSNVWDSINCFIACQPKKQVFSVYFLKRNWAYPSKSYTSVCTNKLHKLFLFHSDSFASFKGNTSKNGTA